MQQKTEILFARCLCNSVHVCRACVSVCATLVCGVRNEELKTVPRYHAHTTPVSLNSTLSRPMAGAEPIKQGKVTLFLKRIHLLIGSSRFICTFVLSNNSLGVPDDLAAQR